MLDWGLGKVVGKGLDYKLMGFFLEIYLKSEVKEGQGRNLLGGGGIEGAA